MPTFAYQAVNGAGKRLRGLEDAATPGALSRALEDRGLLVLDVAESTATATGGKGFKFGRRREVLEVTRAMAALLPVGMPLARDAVGGTRRVSAPILAAVRGTRARRRA